MQRGPPANQSRSPRPQRAHKRKASPQPSSIRCTGLTVHMPDQEQRRVQAAQPSVPFLTCAHCCPWQPPSCGAALHSSPLEHPDGVVIGFEGPTDQLDQHPPHVASYSRPRLSNSALTKTTKPGRNLLPWYPGFPAARSFNTKPTLGFCLISLKPSDSGLQESALAAGSDYSRNKATCTSSTSSGYSGLWGWSCSSGTGKHGAWVLI
jgi:hypothetical protein